MKPIKKNTCQPAYDPLHERKYNLNSWGGGGSVYLDTSGAIDVWLCGIGAVTVINVLSMSDFLVKKQTAKSK